MFRNKPMDRSKLPPAFYTGTVTGIYSDAQSRMIVEITITVNGIEKLVKKQKYQLGFDVIIGQRVIVEFVPNKSGVFINVKKDK